MKSLNKAEPWPCLLSHLVPHLLPSATWWEGIEKTDMGSSERCAMKGHETQDSCCNNRNYENEKTFKQDVSQALQQVAQMGYGIHILWEVQNLTELVYTGPTLKRLLNLMAPRGAPSSLQKLEYSRNTGKHFSICFVRWQFINKKKKRKKGKIKGCSLFYH